MNLTLIHIIENICYLKSYQPNFKDFLDILILEFIDQYNNKKIFVLFTKYIRKYQN